MGNILIFLGILIIGTSISGIVWVYNRKSRSLDSGTLSFPFESAVFDATIRKKLQILGRQMLAEPMKGVIIWGGQGGTKRSQQVDWVRADQMILYMNKVGVGGKRFSYQLTYLADDNTIRYEESKQEGGAPMGPAPYPEFKVPTGF